MQEEQFDEEHPYYQWLERRYQSRKPSSFLNFYYWPIIPAIFVSISFGQNVLDFLLSVCIAYLIFLPFAQAFILLVLYAPHYFQEDISSGFMQSLLVTDIPSSEIIADLRNWVLGKFDEHPLPIGFLRFITLAILTVLIAFLTNIPAIIVIVIVAWLSFRFLLGAGLIGAVLPRWISAGGLLLGWALVNITLTAFSEFILCNAFWLAEGNDKIYLGIALAVIIAIFYAIGEIQLRIAPRLLELRRQGVWE
jgi:hypothetical protein